MHLNILQLFSGSLNWVFQTLWDEHVPNFILMEQLETNIIRDGSSAAHKVQHRLHCLHCFLYLNVC